MRQLRKILFITEEDIRLHINGDALEAMRGEETLAHIPMHRLEGIVSFSHEPATAAAMARIASEGIPFSALSPSGRLRFQVSGELRGNVLLRKAQIIKSEEESFRLPVERAMVCAKIGNCAAFVSEFRNNHPAQTQELRPLEASLYQSLNRGEKTLSENALRGIEGSAARAYFEALGSMIVSPDSCFRLVGRTRRPPKDPCNALLSLAYSCLTAECIGALESVGLDPCVGLLHGDRPGKPALALDLMEELRPIRADRLVLRLINTRLLTANAFEKDEGGVRLTKEGKKLFFTEWSNSREKEVFVPHLGSRVAMGLLPFIQAKQLADLFAGRGDTYIALKKKG